MSQDLWHKVDVQEFVENQEQENKERMARLQERGCGNASV